MSYRCERCGKAIAKKKPQFKVQTRTQEAHYSNGGKGSQTVSESAVCSECRPLMPAATVVEGIAQVDTPRPALKKNEQRRRRY
jgi:hypothetical protein